jgi:hypothetical protein
MAEMMDSEMAIHPDADGNSFDCLKSCPSHRKGLMHSEQQSLEGAGFQGQLPPANGQWRPYSANRIQMPPSP